MSPIANTICMPIARESLVHLSHWLSISPFYKKVAQAKLDTEQCCLGPGNSPVTGPII